RGHDDDNPLGAAVSFESIRTEANQKVVRMRFAFPAPPEAGGATISERGIRVWAVCEDAAGNRGTPVSRGDTARVGSGEKGPAYLSDGIDMALPPGAYAWSIAVRDMPSGLTSYVTVKRTL